MHNKYFDFLCNIVDADGSKKQDRLLEELHGIDFYSLIPNDDNRGEDGKQLRNRFLDGGGPQALSHCKNGPCTVLEMLIGLSIRLEFETAQSQWEKTPAEWFWILIDNLGLIGFDGGCLRSEDIYPIVKIFLDRRYGSDGSGGLFPLHNPKRDQRRVEIWYQMSDYILENYPV